MHSTLDLADLNWTAHPYFAKWQGQYGSTDMQTADELILTCKATGAEALIQMNAALALVEGVTASLDLSLRLMRKLKAAKVHVRHVSFGNEDYGPWETPFGDVPVNGEIYGKAFSTWVDGMRAEFPDVAYGVVGLWTPNDGAAFTSKAPDEWCLPRAASGGSPSAARVCDGVEAIRVVNKWMPDMLRKTDAVVKADWLVLHDYFTKAATTSDAMLPLRTRPLSCHLPRLPSPSVPTFGLLSSSDRHRLTNAQLLNNTALLHAMPKGVADFIARSSPSTPQPKLALTEFNVATTNSGNSNATARLVNALFLGTLIGEALTTGSVAALAEFGWHASWFEKATPLPPRSGSYGMVTFGRPAWAPDDLGGTPLPKLYAQLLVKLATGSNVVPVAHVGRHVAGLRSYASEFDTGELGIILINHDAQEGVRVAIGGLGITGLRAARFAHGIEVNGWVLEGNASTVMPQLGATSLLDAPAVLINGVGNGRVLGGPWPVDANSSVQPYRLSSTSPSAQLNISVPPASLIALIVHGARPAEPSPPPLPPSPPPLPPSSPPPCFTASYADCYESHCCENARRFGCFKRPTHKYAQCRPLVPSCQDSAEWLCPGWWARREAP